MSNFVVPAEGEHVTFSRRVEVSYPTGNGTRRKAEIDCDFFECDQEVIDQMIEEAWSNSEVLDEVLAGCRGVASSEAPDVELPPEQGKQTAMRSPRACAAMVQAYFADMAGEGKKSGRRTSRRRRVSS